jgi:biopolymer transport protein ExbD
MAADAPRFFNVWLVQPNTVYRGVPFTVVADWIQEGRLLGRDCVRSPGAPAWEHLDAHPLFSPYFAGDGVARAEDVGEALDPIDIDFEPKPKPIEEDEDPDMIPLIDISMVLLVFFMMTAQDLMTQSPVKVPSVRTAEITSGRGQIIVSVRRDPDNPNNLTYHFKENYADRFTEQEVIDRVSQAKAERGANMMVIIQADHNIEFRRVQSLMMGIEGLGIKKIVAKVSPKKESGG